MKIDILLIDPPGRTTHVPNTGLAYICANLKKQGLRAKVIDLNMKREPGERCLEYIDKSGIIGISVKANVFHQALDMANQIKSHGFQGSIVFGGPHITVVGEKILKENPLVDYGLRGEGEYALMDFYNSLDVPDKSNIPGLIWRREGQIISNPCNFIKNLDELPFPDYTDFDSWDIIERGFRENIADIIYPIVTSRGCPYKCIYCSVNKIMGQVFRPRTPENCIEELMTARDRYGVEQFQVLDDTFTQNIDRVKIFCMGLINRKLNFKWMCPNGIRADRFDFESANLMKKSGCRRIAFGVESTDREVLEKVNKKISFEKTEESIKITKSVGIEPHAFFIVGLPGANFEKDLKSLIWSKEMDVGASFWMLVPYEGTPLWDMKDGRMLMDYALGAHFGPDTKVVYETDDYPAEDRRAFFYIANFLSPLGRWITLCSFHGGRSELIFYLLKNSFARSINLGIDVLGAVLNEFFIQRLRKTLIAILDFAGLKEPVKVIFKKMGLR